MIKRRVIKRKIADDLIRAIYKAEGWTRHDKAGFNSCSARCSLLYVITADPRSNKYIATPKAAGEDE